MIVTMIVVSRSAPAMERRLRFDVGHIGGLYRRLSSTEGAWRGRRNWRHRLQVKSLRVFILAFNAYVPGASIAVHFIKLLPMVQLSTDWVVDDIIIISSASCVIRRARACYVSLNETVGILWVWSVLTLTHRQKIQSVVTGQAQSVVTGQAPIALRWRWTTTINTILTTSIVF